MTGSRPGKTPPDLLPVGCRPRPRGPAESLRRYSHVAGLIASLSRALLCSCRRNMPHSPRGHDAGGGRWRTSSSFSPACRMSSAPIARRLRHALTRPNVEIKIQEDFQALGGDTLAMLEAYVETCNVVVHFVGEMAGAAPKPTSVDDLLRRRAELATRLADKGMGREALRELTYTQWEAWLAIGFNKDGAKKNLVIVAPAAGLKRRGRTFRPTDASRAAQAEHLRRLRAINLYPGPPFTSANDLKAQVLASAVLDVLILAGTPPKTKPRNLPLPSLGGLFAGREARARRPAHGASRCEGRRGGVAWAWRGRQDAACDRIWMGARGRPFGAPVRQRQRRGEPERGPRRPRRPGNVWTCRRRRRATTRPRSPRPCAGWRPTRPG